MAYAMFPTHLGGEFEIIFQFFSLSSTKKIIELNLSSFIFKKQLYKKCYLNFLAFGGFMNLKINNINHEFNVDKISISEILKILNYTFPIIIVKHGENIIQQSDFDSYYVCDKAEITIMHIFAGG